MLIQTTRASVIVATSVTLLLASTACAHVKRQEFQAEMARLEQDVRDQSAADDAALDDRIDGLGDERIGRHNSAASELLVDVALERAAWRNHRVDLGLESESQQVEQFQIHRIVHQQLHPTTRDAARQHQMLTDDVLGRRV